MKAGLLKTMLKKMLFYATFVLHRVDYFYTFV